MACTIGIGTYMSTSQEAKTTSSLEGGEPHAMTMEDNDKILELLEYAPWAIWGTTANNVPVVELKNVAKPDSHAMHKAQECLAGIKQVCINVQSFFKELKREGILTRSGTGSIPSIMKTAMKAATEMEKDHMTPIAALIYDTEGTNKASVKDVKEMIRDAARDLAKLQQYLQEAKALVQQYRREEAKKEEIGTLASSD